MNLSEWREAGPVVPDSNGFMVDSKLRARMLREAWFDRDLSWLEFNRRVLAEAYDERVPLLERLKFLAIFTSNLDEFFMKRVGAMRTRAYASGNLATIEKTREYRGRYHVLWGALSPLKGIGPDEIDVEGLVSRVTSEVREVVIATNPNVEGEATALYLAKRLKPTGARVTRIAFGLPVGGDIEYADEVTMARSLENRREL